jgi:hypothetical protein
VDGTGPGSYPVAGVHISDGKPVGSVTGVSQDLLTILAPIFPSEQILLNYRTIVRFNL